MRRSSRSRAVAVTAATLLAVGISILIVAVTSTDGGGGHSSVVAAQADQSNSTNSAAQSSLGDCTDPKMVCSPEEREAAARVLQEEATSTTIPTPSADEAVKIATTAGVATFNRVDSTRTKVVRVGDVRAVVEPGARARNDDDQGWMVLITGDIQSDAGNSITRSGPTQYTWWLTVVDQKDGLPVLFDGGTGEPPQYFDTVPGG